MNSESRTLRLRDYATQLMGALDEGNLVLFLGAGVSMPHGVPNWTDLVVELLLSKAPELCNITPRYRTALGSWLMDAFDFDPVTLSRAFKSGKSTEEYREQLRAALYKRRVPAPADRDSLSAVARLVKWTVQDSRGPRIRKIITTNFDNLLEQALMARDVPFAPIWNDRISPREDALPILHVHGYLPQGQPIATDQRVIFTEDEYHDLTFNLMQWAVMELLHVMRTSTILFIGCSLVDPNVRRLLDATSGGKIRHYAFRRSYSIGDSEREVAWAQVKRRAECLQPNGDDGEPRPEMIDKILDHAHTCDEKTFAQLGVRMLWVDSWSEVGQVIDQLLLHMPKYGGSGGTRRKPPASGDPRTVLRVRRP